MDFSALLSRCDAQILQEILGKECVRLLGLMDSSMSSPTFVRKLLTDAAGESALLLDKRHRQRLLELLRPDEAEDLCAILGLDMTKGPYSAVKSVNPGRGSPLEAALFTFFERTAPPVEMIEERVAQSTCPSEYPLFEHQRRATREVLQCLDQAPYRVLLHMPTGSGKTRTAMNVISEFLRSNEPSLVIWVAYSEELCEQAADEFMTTWRYLGDRELLLRRFWGGHEVNMSDLSDGLLVAGCGSNDCDSSGR
jgi:DNA repair protein RadD